MRLFISVFLFAISYQIFLDFKISFLCVSCNELSSTTSLTECNTMCHLFYTITYYDGNHVTSALVTYFVAEQFLCFICKRWKINEERFQSYYICIIFRTISPNINNNTLRIL